MMASIAFRCKLLGHYCTIVTDDKDLWQCLGNKTTIYSPRAKEFRDENWLLANHKIGPKQVVDWLCMTGKDDAPACPGIGPKTASELLSKFSNFWDIYAARDTFTAKRKAAIEGFAKEDYWIAQDLHKLRIDLCGFH